MKPEPTCHRSDSWATFRHRRSVYTTTSELDSWCRREGWVVSSYTTRAWHGTRGEGCTLSGCPTTSEGKGNGVRVYYKTTTCHKRREGRVFHYNCTRPQLAIWGGKRECFTTRPQLAIRGGKSECFTTRPQLAIGGEMGECFTTRPQLAIRGEKGECFTTRPQLAIRQEKGECFTTRPLYDTHSTTCDKKREGRAVSGCTTRQQLAIRRGKGERWALHFNTTARPEGMGEVECSVT